MSVLTILFYRNARSAVNARGGEACRYLKLFMLVSRGMAAPSISDSVRRTAAVGIALATAWAGGSCVSDHDALARRPEIKGGGSGGGRDAAEESVSSAGGGA